MRGFRDDFTLTSRGDKFLEFIFPGADKKGFAILFENKNYFVPSQHFKNFKLGFQILIIIAKHRPGKEILKYIFNNILFAFISRLKFVQILFSNVKKFV